MDPERLIGIVVWVVGPAFSLLCLVPAIWWRRRSPQWFTIWVCVPPLALVAHLNVRLAHPGIDSFDVVVTTWLLASFACLALAAVGVTRGWGSRGALLVGGLLLEAPFMAYCIRYFISVVPQLS